MNEALQFLGSILSVFGNAQTQYSQQQISYQQYQNALKAYEDSLKQLTDQYELDWYQAEQLYGTAMYDVDGDGFISRSDYENAPALLKPRMVNLVGGTPDDPSGQTAWVRNEGVVDQRGNDTYTSTWYDLVEYSTDADGNWVATGNTRETKNPNFGKDVVTEIPGRVETTYKFEDTDVSTPITLGTIGQYEADVFAGAEKTYEDLWGEDGYYSKIFGGQMETYNALKTAFENAGLPTPTEEELRARYTKMTTEGDPELQKLLDAEANRAYGAIRQQGGEAMTRTMGHIVGTGLESSIVARELTRQTDRDTLKAMSETARDIALANQKAQFDVKKGARTSLDTLNLSLDQRKRSSILSLAGLTEPIEAVAPAAPVKPPTGYSFPIFGAPGTRPTDTSGQYSNPYGMYGDLFTALGGTGTDEEEF